MHLSDKALNSLVDIVIGNSGISPYRKGYELVEFFNRFGWDDKYSFGRDFPSRSTYTEEKLTELNGTPRMREVILEAFRFIEDDETTGKQAMSQFNRALAQDGYTLDIVRGPGWTEQDKYIPGVPRVEVRELTTNLVTPEGLIELSHTSINNHIAKANSRIQSGDHSGAISVAYTLVEQVLKLILAESSDEFKETEGDIRSLYRQVQRRLNLSPGSPEISASLKPILDGLQKLVAGLYEISNKAGDRHASNNTPAMHHAKVAVNAALALSEFLIETHANQSDRTKSSLDQQRNET